MKTLRDFLRYTYENLENDIRRFAKDGEEDLALESARNLRDLRKLNFFVLGIDLNPEIQSLWTDEYLAKVDNES